jgi:receptor expression-enhancing protein 1/2/3/4
MIVLLVNILIAAMALYNLVTAHQLAAKDKGSHRRYTKYFTVMTIFLLFDSIFSFIFRYVPFYQLFKFLIAVWLSLPACSGAVFAYRVYVRGFLEKYGGECDKTIEQIKETVSKYLYEYYQKASSKYAEHRGKKQDTAMGIRGDVEEEVSDSGFSTIDSRYEPIEEKPGQAKWASPPDNEENRKP